MDRRLATLVLLGAGLAACGSDGDETVNVFAASSLTEAFGELAEAFEATNPDVAVELNVAGSSALREQILEGAPADVFASADETNMGELAAAGELAGSPRAFATNRMAIGVPPGNPAGIEGLDDLAAPELLVGLCASGVPCGDLARAVLAAAGIEPAVDTEEPNVRALAAKIEDGELDVGLVYVTDVEPVGGLTGLPIAAEVDLVATYPIAVVDGASVEADAFAAFVLSPTGREILADHGFGPP